MQLGLWKTKTQETRVETHASTFPLGGLVVKSIHIGAFQKRAVARRFEPANAVCDVHLGLPFPKNRGTLDQDTKVGLRFQGPKEAKRSKQK